MDFRSREGRYRLWKVEARFCPRRSSGVGRVVGSGKRDEFEDLVGVDWED